ncbi:MAG: NAD(P)H-hydrate dehydratase [Acidobacteria bacterium]|nr:NAD(P)H-hydrate dehydratase [Acidobacteriota bacterium]
MIVLSSEAMREIDQRTIAAGTPSEVLMLRAAERVVEMLKSRFSLPDEKVAVVCGKGNNGGDGLIVARLLKTMGIEPSLWPEDGAPTVVVDAVLGIGVKGPARGEPLEQIRWINRMRHAGAKVVAVDVPSGVGSGGEFVTADYTISFAALKPVHVLPPWCEACGEVTVGDIGTLPAESDLHLLDPPQLPPRAKTSHKGDFGHVLVVGGAPGKTGAAQMTGLAALRAGAGLVTVTAAVAAVPELMSCPLNEPLPLDGKTVLAVGPGLGLEYTELVRHLYATSPLPMVIDADGLNSLAQWPLPVPPAPRILTPHPGEFRRLRLGAALDGEARVEQAREFAQTHQVTLVLKGFRTLIAHPDGQVHINPTGSPAMAKAGSGDILTGMIAGFYAQQPSAESVHAAVWLHGRSGELGAQHWTDRCLLATDLLTFLPQAIRNAQ